MEGTEIMGRYKEILFGLFLGLAMWVADALMHTMMPMAAGETVSFAKGLLEPTRPQLVTRVFFIALALSLGWALWRSNRRVRELRELERRIATLHRQMINPAALVLDGCNTLLRGGGLTGETLEVVQEIRRHARQIDEFAKDFPRHQDPRFEPRRSPEPNEAPDPRTGR